MNTFTLRALEVVGGMVAVAVMGLSFVATADAASYAYVDVQGEVQQVIATDWQTAIDVAPNIHDHSGVLILRSADDFEIVGDDVPSI